MKALKTMSSKELKQVIDQAQTLLTERQEREKAELKEKMAAMAAEAGLNLRELMNDGRGRSSSNGEVKYRHPRNPELTWSGRGRRPNWMSGARNIERFRVS
jgi:DNA-binding protein H-NS